MAFLANHLEKMAASFWEGAGALEPYPRNLEDPILCSLPLSIVKLSKPGVVDVQEWLLSRGLAVPELAGTDRPIFGCLVAFAGKGFIFLDGSASAGERRITLAHELAHFLRDYHEPRQQAIARLGFGILEVLNGARPPTNAERVDALLARVAIGPQTHLMFRGSGGRILHSETTVAESEVRQLALELLAPHRDVLNYAGTSPMQKASKELMGLLPPVLETTFGLPTEVAAGYGDRLAHAFGRRVTIREWLGL